MERKRVAILSIICFFIALIISSVCNTSIGKSDALKQVNIDLNQLIPIGYDMEGNKYKNVVGDAHLVYENIDAYVSTVNIMLQQSAEKDIPIQIYYSNDEHDYNEETSVEGVIGAGSNSIDIKLDSKVKDIRFDITYVNGETFDLAAITINDLRSINSDNEILAFTKYAKIFTAVLVMVLVFILGMYRPKIENTFVIMSLIIGIVYMFIITPLSGPDEPLHYHSSYKLSNILMLKWDSIDYGDSVDFDYHDYTVHKNVKTGYYRLMEEGFGIQKEQGEQIIVPQLNNLYYPMMYLAPAVGITIGRLFNGNLLSMFYLGRLCNLLFFIMCMYIAIRKIPIMKMSLFVIGMLPMTIHQAASLSYDSFIIGVSMVLIAYLLSAIFGKGEITKKEYFGIVISATLLAPAKILYCLIIGLIVFIPRERFKSKKDYLIKICFAIGIMMIVCGIVSLSQVLNIAEKSNTVNWDGGKTYSLGFVLGHPLQVIKIYIMTIKRFGLEWILECIGYKLSGLSLKISPVVCVAFMGLLSAASLRRKEEQLLIENKVLFGGAAIFILTAIAIMLSMFIWWTSDTLDVIVGVQGRYFIPVLPYICFLANRLRITMKEDTNKYIMIGCALLQVNCIFSVINYTLR